MSNIKQLEGKPFIVKLDGRTRTIGEIDIVSISPERDQLRVMVLLKDEEVAGILGAAADKSKGLAQGDEWSAPPGATTARLGLRSVDS